MADQCRYNVANRTVEVELLPFCRETGYGLVPHSPLHSGILTGKYEAGKAAPPDSRGSAPSDRFREWLTDRTYRAAEAVCAVAGDRGVSPSQVAIRWVLDNPLVNATIIGPRTMEQFEDNLGALGWALSEEERSRLNDAAPPDAHWD